MYEIKLYQLKNVLKNGMYCFTYFWNVDGPVLGSRTEFVFLRRLDFFVYFPPPFTTCITFGVSVP